MSPEEKFELTGKRDKEYEESIKPKPEEKATNVQDEYDAKLTLDKDAEKSAPPSHESIEYTKKNNASLPEHN